MAPNAPTELLIWSLYCDPGGVSAMKPFIGDDAVSKGSPATTRTEWFVGLAAEITTQGLKYEDYLDSRWNPLIIEYGTSRPKLNPLGLPVRVWARRPVWFDPEFALFYEYESSTGIWRQQSEERLKQQVTDFLIPMAHRGAAFLATNRAVEDIVKTLKVLGLKESCETPEQPLHFANTMLFMESNKVAPFSPAYYSRNRVAIQYDKRDTGCTSFRNFLSDSLDEDDINLLQLWSGMVLLNRNPFHKIMLLTGAAGSGKSTFIDILERILGSENVATLVVDRLEDRFELSEFFGKSLLIAKDVSSAFLQSKKAHVLKALSGDRHIKAEVKFSNKRVMLEGPFNVGITANADLNISLQGDMDAWKRRLLIVKFDPAARVAEGRPPIVANTKLVDQLISKESSGILNWMLAGARQVLQAERRRQQFPVSDTQAKRINSLLTASDAVTSFLKDSVQSSPGGSLATAVLYAGYENYCSSVGTYPEPRSVFERRLPPLMLSFFKSKAGILPAKDAGARMRGYADVSLRHG